MTSQEVRDAKSRCADKFMEQHPEVAVKARAEKTWEVWHTGTIERAFGLSREGAIKDYRDRYHPEKPPLDRQAKLYKDMKEFCDSICKKELGMRDVYMGKPPPGSINSINYNPGDTVRNALADSAKYRRVVELFIAKYPVKFPFASGSFSSDLLSIIESDMPTHCDKCYQELK